MLTVKKGVKLTITAPVMPLLSRILSFIPNVPKILTVKNKLTGIKPEIVLAASIMDQVYSQYHIQDCVITSALDGVHKKGSKHYTGDALDFRTRHMPKNIAILIVGVVQQRLGNDYDVILESNHIHCEYDPK